MSNRPAPLLRAAAIAEATESQSHPWNPRSEIHGTVMSRMTGMARVAVNLIRVPPGKESFAYHLHHREEEWLYILSGRGVAEIDGAEHEVGPGDFMGFAVPSVAHHLRNPFDEDLVYLMGGELLDHEIADFPRLGRRMVRTADEITSYPLDAGRPFGAENDG